MRGDIGFRFAKFRKNALGVLEIGLARLETVIGKWLGQRKRRDDVVLMTKVGSGESAASSGSTPPAHDRARPSPPLRRHRDV